MSVSQSSPNLLCQHERLCDFSQLFSNKANVLILSGPNITANLYCICLSDAQMQYKSAVIYETPSIKDRKVWI